MTIGLESPSLFFRSAQPEDAELLFDLFADSRQTELAATDWSAGEKERFLRWQFELQTASFRERFPLAAFWIVLAGQRPIGRYYIHVDQTEIRLIDLALLPEERGKGFGSFLLRQLIEQSLATGKPIRLHVEQTNRALHWYLRFGFRPIGQQGIYWALERPAQSPTS
jgi:ribosomal protein S18 acetylase RimI-like enzyme